MLRLLAETDKEQALAEGYLLIFGIAVAGLVGVLMLIGIFLLRRATQRRLSAIEQARDQRRQAASAGRVDAWTAGADRYVDHDKLPDNVPYDSQPDPDDDAEAPEQGALDEDDPHPPGWEDPEAEEEQDPYGLFEDKPYREPDDDEDDDGDDEEERWDEDERP